MDRKWMENGYKWPTSRSFLSLTLLFLLKIIAFQWYYGIHPCHAYTNTQVYVYIMWNTLKYDLEHTKRKESFDKPSSSTKWYVCSWSLWNSICSMLQLIFSYMRLNMIKICDTMFHVASYSSQYVRSPTLGLSKPSKIFWFQMVLITKGASLHASTIIPPQRSDGKGATNRKSVDNWPFPAFQKQWAGSRLKCRCLFLLISFWILLSCSMGMAIGLNKHEKHEIGRKVEEHK
jgi:hypothetical protein